MSNTDSNSGQTAMVMDDDRSRKEMLTEAFDFDDDVDSSTIQNSDANSNTAANKNKAKTAANRFKTSRNVTPSQTATQNTVSNAYQNQQQIRNNSQMQNMPANTNQMMGRVTNSNQNGNANTFQVQGTNIGSKASEPAWTAEQLQKIATAMGTALSTVTVVETRRPQADPEGKYLAVGQNDSIITKPAAILPDAGFSAYKLGIGKVKPDEKTGKSKLYSDVVMKGPNWMLTQWTSKNVVMEGVPDNILDKPPRVVNGRAERRIGHEFARLGLPKESFAPVFETLRAGMPSILDGISQTAGYYWLNASWGVTNSPGNFVYRNSNGSNGNTHRLYEAMKMISGRSSIGAASIAISVGNESKMEGGRLIPDPGKYELSIKIHNMFHIRKVDYHSPPQSSATGFEVTDDILAESESLDPISSTGSTFDSTAGAFSGGGMNPFFGASAAMGSNSAVGPGNQQLMY